VAETRIAYSNFLSRPLLDEFDSRDSWENVFICTNR
jgi:hypothetical protein